MEEDAAKEEIALLEQEGDYAEETSVDSINLEEELNAKVDALKGEFTKPFNVKGKKITWIETLDVTSTNPIDQHLNVDDDIKRELFFYNATKENTIAGMIKLKKLGEKINRPDDCFVEMLKSDEQMANMKKEIIKEQQYIKKFEAKKQKLAQMGRRVFNLEGNDEEVANKAIDALVSFYENDMGMATHISAFIEDTDRTWIDRIVSKFIFSS